MTQPFFSICIPNYNRAEMLRRAMHSVLDQDFGDYELIVSDDASTDNAGEVVASFRDSRIRFCRNRVNMGLYPNHNVAWREASADWILFLHNDDVLNEGALSTCHRILVGGGALALSDLLVYYEGVGVGESPNWLDGIEAALLHIRGGGKGVSGSCLSKRLLESLNGFETAPDVGYFADWDLFIRAGVAGYRLGLLESPLISIGVHPGQELARWLFTGRYFCEAGSVLYRNTQHRVLLERILSDMKDWSPSEIYKLLIFSCSFPDTSMAFQVYQVARERLTRRFEQRALKHYYVRRLLGRTLYWLVVEGFYRLCRRQESLFPTAR